jgi:hypothetical protein
LRYGSGACLPARIGHTLAQVQALTGGGAYSCSIFTGTSPGRHLAVIPAAGGPPIKLFDMPGDSWNVGPYWTPDGRALQYLLVHDDVSNNWVPVLGRVPLLVQATGHL